MQREDDTFTLLQVGAWNRTADLLDAYRARLDALLAALAEAWPPVDGSASRAYLEKLRELISSIAQTRDQAAANGYTVDSMMDRLMNARSAMQALNKEYQTTRAPDAVNKRARSVMTDADTSIYDHGTRLITIDQYRAPFGQKQSMNDSVLGSASALGGSVEDGWPTPGGTPNDFGVTESQLGAPTLVGGATVIPSPGRVLPSRGVAAGDTTDTVSSYEIPMASVRRWAVRDLSDGYSGQQPGGRIGQTRGRVARQGSEPSAIRDVHPPVAGESEASGHALLTSGLTAGAGRSRSRSRSSGVPYSQWETPDGVPSILEPEPDPGSHDPGRGIWGIDR